MAEDYDVFQTYLGMQLEEKIEASRIREVFTPHAPISDLDMLAGRRAEVQVTVSAIKTAGCHVLLYGDRGVGKSSLANVIAILFPGDVKSRVFTKRCSRGETFASIVLEPIREVGGDLLVTEIVESTGRKIGGGVRFASAERSKGSQRTFDMKSLVTPSTVAAAIKDLDGLLIIDEAEAISNRIERRKIAELMKLLSDSKSTFKIMVVGIATVGEELISFHESIQRCLRQVKLERMSEQELREIVVNGTAACKLSFSVGLTDRIVQLSAGFPYFTHLISLILGELAIGAGRVEVDESHLRDALIRAVKDAEVAMRQNFDGATRSAGNPAHLNFVVAAASIPEEEFDSNALRKSFHDLTGEDISSSVMSNCVTRLVSDDNSLILNRVAKGVYRFSDPRMVSYVRMRRAIDLD